MFYLYRYEIKVLEIQFEIMYEVPFISDSFSDHPFVFVAFLFLPDQLEQHLRTVFPLGIL